MTQLVVYQFPQGPCTPPLWRTDGLRDVETSYPSHPKTLKSITVHLEQRQGVRSISWPRLIDIPMLHHASAVQTEHICHGQLPSGDIQMHKPNVSVKSLVHDRPAHARDQILEELYGGRAPLRRVGRVVDVVRGDVGQVGGGGVLEHVELVDKVEEDGVLLAWGCGLGGAEWCLGWLRVVVGCWGCEEGGKSGEGEGRED